MESENSPVKLKVRFCKKKVQQILYVLKFEVKKWQALKAMLEGPLSIIYILCFESYSSAAPLGILLDLDQKSNTRLTTFVDAWLQIITYEKIYLTNVLEEKC